MAAFYEGDRVLAQWDGGEFWFPGRVHSVGGDGAVAVRYDDGMSDIRPPNQVKRFDWAIGSRTAQIPPMRSIRRAVTVAKIGRRMKKSTMTVGFPGEDGTGSGG